jgi:hypothetical protein
MEEIHRIETLHHLGWQKDVESLENNGMFTTSKTDDSDFDGQSTV